MLKRISEKLSIRLRITLLVSVLLMIMALVFTMFSIESSRRHFAAVPLGQSLLASIQSTESTEMSATLTEIPLSGTVPNEMMGDVMLFTEASAVVMDAQKSFSSEQILALLLITALGIAMTYLILGRALRPLTRLSREMESIHEHNLEALSAVSTQDEIGSLAQSFNDMLLRLRHSFEVQRNFAANAAHELKTPLAVMKSSLQVLGLDEKPELEEYRENSVLCAETVEQMIALVSDLLLISSAQEEQLASLDLAAIVRQSLKGQEQALAARGISVQYECPETTLQSKQSLLTAIVDNLVSNAVKYNKDGGCLLLTLRGENDMAILRVADSGIGIPEESIGDVFESFYRVDPSRSKEVEGNGLGLAIVKAAVEHLGGTIAVKSRLGEGTVFTVRLPLDGKRQVLDLPSKEASA